MKKNSTAITVQRMTTSCRSLLIFFLLSSCAHLTATVELGIERLLTERAYSTLLHGQRIGILSNQSGIDSHMRSSVDRLLEAQDPLGFKVTALFSPEHGFRGSAHAWTKVDHATYQGVPVYSLYGVTRRPTPEMLSQVDSILFDIQDIGSRSYTYISTLFYVMEEAAKANVAVIILDRPNPINGVTIDGPLLDEELRSLVGYINVPYCHGMTVGELAHFFNEEYAVHCKLKVVPMKGWTREMTFADTGLPWIPTSPHIPEADSPLYYPCTGILGELQIVNIGVGYTLPFKLVGAPWIDGKSFAEKLNAQNFPGVHFQEFHFRPFYGRFKAEDCQGVLIRVTDHTRFLPVSTQYLLIGMLKTLYPKYFEDALARSKDRVTMFNKVNGSEEIYRILSQETYVTWKMRAVDREARTAFAEKRQAYLRPEYASR
jgi:uncharacterized protein YbbC (DUF1343 family)